MSQGENQKMTFAPHLTVPTLHHWPPAVRSAELLAGVLVRCGPGVRPIGWPESPPVRLAAISEVLEGGYIAISQTAAWVWGAARDPGHRLQVSVPPGRRLPQLQPRDITVRQLRLEPDDLIRLGEHTVSSPLRTLKDIVQGSAQFTSAEVVNCRLLALRVPDAVTKLRHAISDGTPAYRRRSRERIQRIWDVCD